MSDSMIEDRLRDFLVVPDDPDWSDVLRRAQDASGPTPASRLMRRHRMPLPQLSRRALVAVGAVCAVSLAVAVPAFGLGQTVIDWFTAPAAPTATQESFYELDTGAPTGMAPNVSGPARSVTDGQVAGASVNLWVAPTSQGGFCFELQSYGGGCDRDRSLPVAAVLAPTTSGGAVLFGDALSPQADHIELGYPDGASTSVPVVQVSQPINSSFFLYEIPASVGLYAKGTRTLSVTAVDANGSAIATTALQVGKAHP
jgi:hypothetical protein